LYGGKQFVRFLNGRGQIRIGKKKNLSLRVQHAITHAEPFTAIAGIFNQAKAWVLLRVLLHYIDCTVAGAVIDDENFNTPFPFISIMKNAMESISDALPFVVRGDYDAVLR